MTNETIAKLQELLKRVIKSTISRSILWVNVKEAMLGDDAFISSQAFQKYVQFNTSSGTQIRYERSYFCTLTTSTATSYLLLTYISGEEADGSFELYTLIPSKPNLIEFTCPEIQPLLRRLSNAILYGHESEEESNALDEIIFPDPE